MIPCNLLISGSHFRFRSRDIATIICCMMIRNWGIRWSACLPHSAPVFPPALDVPWPSRTFNRRFARYVKRYQAFPIRFDITRSRRPHSASSPDISDPDLNLHRFHPIFTLLSRSFHPPDFVNSFRDHDRTSTRPHSDAFFDVRWHCSASLGFRSAPFLNKLIFNRVSVPHIAIDFLNMLFLARGWPGRTNASHS
jgi:hypothetical protein